MCLLRSRNVTIANYYNPEKPGFINKVLELEASANIRYVNSVIIGFTLIRKSIRSDTITRDWTDLRTKSLLEELREAISR